VPILYKMGTSKVTDQIDQTIETDGDNVVASLDDIEAFAYADTEFEAIDGLCEEIVALYEDLRKNRKNLGALPQKWLAYLDEAVTVRENS